MTRLVVVIGDLGMVSLLYLYILDIHMCHQEYILPVGLYRKLQYPSTIGGNKVMGKLLWSVVTF